MTRGGVVAHPTVAPPTVPPSAVLLPPLVPLPADAPLEDHGCGRPQVLHDSFPSDPDSSPDSTLTAAAATPSASSWDTTG